MDSTRLPFGDRAIDIVADDKIRAAIEDGQFCNLPGLGQPHPIFDEPYDPHWWLRRKLDREGLKIERSPGDGAL